jgi:amino acid transporter
MADQPAPPDPRERQNRELIEVLNELRIVLPGALMLFAFLLSLPFSARFGEINGLETVTYFVAFLSSGTAAVFLMTPTAYHRLRWRKNDKEALLRATNRLCVAGLMFLAVAIVAVVGLVVDLVVSEAAGFLVAAVSAALIVTLWFGLPLERTARKG